MLFKIKRTPPKYLQKLILEKVFSGPGSSGSLGQFLSLTPAFPAPSPLGLHPPPLAFSDLASWPTSLPISLLLSRQPFL